MEPAAQVEGGVPGMGVLIDNRPRRARAGAARKRAAPSPWLSAGGCSVRAAAQRLRSFLGRRRRRRRRRCSADPSHGTAAGKLLIHHVHTKRRPLKVGQRYSPAYSIIRKIAT